MKTKMKNILLVIGVLILLVSACGPLGRKSTPVDAPEPIVEASETPASVPTEAVAEEPALPGVSSYIGMVYPPLPFGFLEGFHLLVQDSDGYELTLVSDGGRRMLWLGKESHTDAGGNWIWEVRDVLDFSQFEPGLTLLPDGCVLNGTPDHEVFVVGKNGEIVLAWRANTASEKFEAVPIDGVSCDSDKAVRLN